MTDTVQTPRWSSPFHAPSRAAVIDTLAALAVGAVFAVMAAWLFGQLNFHLLATNHNFWFDADPSRPVKALGGRWDWEHARSNLHPLWSLFFATPALGLGLLIGHQASVAVYVATCGLLLGATLYLALRRFAISPADAALACALFLSTSTAWLWLGMPETFVAGAASALIPLIWLGARPGRFDEWTGVAQSVFAMSITITNWVSGILSAFLKLGWRACLRISVYAFAAGAALSVVQYLIFPKSARYFDIWPEATYDYGDAGSLFDRLRAFFFHSLAAPTPVLITPHGAPHYGDRLSRVQFSQIAHTPLSLAYFAVWAVLIVLALRALRGGKVASTPALFVGGLLLFNLALHMVYGPETFLFAMHFVPLFTIIAAWALTNPSLRPLARVAMVAGMILGVAHNGPAFRDLASWHNKLQAPVGFQEPKC